LHQRGNPFILANAWDASTAKILAALGAQAIGTTSAGYGFSLGLPDMGHLTRDQHLSHASDLVSATDLPVSGDFENGFGDDPETVAQTIKLACEAGVAGCCIEDTNLPSLAPYGFDLTVERIKAATSAARTLPRDFVLVARADGVMNGQYNIDEAIKRAQAFEAVGADCIYVPGLKTFEDLKRLNASVSVPVNVLTVGEMTKFNRQDFADIGIGRISLGSTLSRAIYGSIIDKATSILDQGDFTSLAKAPVAKTIVDLLDKGSAKQ
jgi:2-methylisocitrate lyase-like PEP mutase family enzyme